MRAISHHLLNERKGIDLPNSVFHFPLRVCGAWHAGCRGFVPARGRTRPRRGGNDGAALTGPAPEAGDREETLASSPGLRSQLISF